MTTFLIDTDRKIRLIKSTLFCFLLQYRCSYCQIKMLVDNLELQLSLNLEKAYQQLEVFQNRTIRSDLAVNRNSVTAGKKITLDAIEKDYYQQDSLFRRASLSELKKQTSLLTEFASYFRSAINVVIQGRGNYDSDEYGIPIAPSPNAPKSPDSSFKVVVERSDEFTSLEQRLSYYNNQILGHYSRQSSLTSVTNNNLSAQLQQSRQNAAQARQDRNRAISSANRDSDRFIRAIVSLKPNRIVSAGLSLATLPLKLAYGSLVSTLQAGVNTAFLVAAQSFQKSLDGSELGDRLENIFNIFTDNFGTSLESGLANFARYIGGYGKNNPSELLARDLGKNLGKIFDIGQLDEAVTDLRKKIIQIAVDTEGSPNRTTDIAKEMSASLYRAAPQQVKALANLLFQTVATPFRINNEIQVAKQAKQIREAVGDGSSLKNLALLKKYGLSSQLPERLLLATAGFQREKGYKGGQLGDMLKPFLTEGTGVIGIRNRDTDRVNENEVTSSVVSFFDTILSKLEIPNNELKIFEREIHNIEVSFLKAFRGYDRDSVSMATIGHLIKTLSPDTDLAAVGFSGGSAIVQQAIQILEALGHTGIKGLGLGGNPIGATSQAKNYKAVISSVDEQAAFYDKTQLHGTLKGLEKVLNLAAKAGKLNGIAQEGHYGIFNIPDNVIVTPRAGDHSVQNYIGTESNYKVLVEELAGFINPKSPEKLEGKLVEIEEFEVALADFTTIVEDAFEAIEAASKAPLKLVEVIEELVDSEGNKTTKLNSVLQEVSASALANTEASKKLVSAIEKDRRDREQLNKKRLEEAKNSKQEVKVNSPTIEEEKTALIQEERKRLYGQLEGEELLAYGDKVYPDMTEAYARRSVAELAKEGYMADAKQFDRSLEKLSARLDKLLTADRKDLADLEAEKASIDPYTGDLGRLEELEKAIGVEKAYLNLERLVNKDLNTLTEALSQISKVVEPKILKDGSLKYDSLNKLKLYEGESLLTKDQRGIIAANALNKVLTKISPKLTDGSVEEITFKANTLKANKQIPELLKSIDLRDKEVSSFVTSYITKRGKDTEFLNGIVNFENKSDIPRELYAAFSFTDAEHRLSNKHSAVGGHLAGFIDYNQLEVYEQAKKLHQEGKISDDFLEVTKVFAHIAYEFEKGVRHLYQTGEDKLQPEFYALAKEFYSNPKYRDKLPSDFFNKLSKTFAFPVVDKKFRESARNPITEENLSKIGEKYKIFENVQSSVSNSDLESIAIQINKDFKRTGKRIQAVSAENIRVLANGFEGIVIADDLNQRVIKIARYRHNVASAIKEAVEESPYKWLQIINKIPVVGNAKKETTADFKTEGDNFSTAIKEGLFNWEFLPTKTKDNQVLASKDFIIQPLLKGDTAGKLLINSLAALKEALGSGQAVDYGQLPSEIKTGLLALVQLGSQTSYLHNQGFDHGDLNPNNLLVSGNQSTAIDYSHLTKLPQVATEDLDQAKKAYIRAMLDIQKSTKSTFDKYSYLKETFNRIVGIPASISSSLTAVSSKFQSLVAEATTKAQAIFNTSLTDSDSVIAALLSAIDEIDFSVLETIIPELSGTGKLTVAERRDLAPQVLTESGYLKDPRRLLELFTKLEKLYLKDNKLPNEVFSKFFTNLTAQHKADYEVFASTVSTIIPSIKEEIATLIAQIPENIKAGQQELFQKIVQDTPQDDPKIVAAREEAGRKYRDSIQQLGNPAKEVKESAVDRAITDTLKILAYNGINVRPELIQALFRSGYNNPTQDISELNTDAVLNRLFTTYQLENPFVEPKQQTVDQIKSNIIKNTFGNFDPTTPDSKQRNTVKTREETLITLLKQSNNIFSSCFKDLNQCLNTIESLLETIAVNTSHDCCPEIINALEAISELFKGFSGNTVEEKKDSIPQNQSSGYKTEDASPVEKPKQNSSGRDDELIAVDSKAVERVTKKALRKETVKDTEREYLGKLAKFNAGLTNLYIKLDIKTKPLQDKIKEVFTEAQELEQRVFGSTDLLTAGWGSPVLNLVKKLSSTTLQNTALNSLGLFGDAREFLYGSSSDLLGQGFDVGTDLLAAKDYHNFLIDGLADAINSDAVQLGADRAADATVALTGDNTSGYVIRSTFNQVDKRLQKLYDKEPKDRKLAEVHHALINWLEENKKEIATFNLHGNTTRDADRFLESKAILVNQIREVFNLAELSTIKPNANLTAYKDLYLKGTNPDKNDILIKTDITKTFKALDKFFDKLLVAKNLNTGATTDNTGKGILYEVIRQRKIIAAELASIADSINKGTPIDTTSLAKLRVFQKNQDQRQVGRELTREVFKNKNEFVGKHFSGKEREEVKKLLETTTRTEAGLLKTINVIFKKKKAEIESLETLGSDVIAGLVEGIEKDQNAPYKAIQEVSKNLIDAARKTLKIASPSRVFRQIGIQILEGLTEGLQSNTKLSSILENTLKTFIRQEEEAYKAYQRKAAKLGQGTMASFPAQIVHSLAIDLVSPRSFTKIAQDINKQLNKEVFRLDLDSSKIKSSVKSLVDFSSKIKDNFNNIGNTKLLDFFPTLKKGMLGKDFDKSSDEQFFANYKKGGIRNLLLNLGELLFTQDKDKNLGQKERVQNTSEFGLVKLSTAALYNATLAGITSSLTGLPPLVSMALVKGVSDVMAGLTVRLAQTVSKTSFAGIKTGVTKLVTNVKEALSSKEGYQNQIADLKVFASTKILGGLKTTLLDLTDDYALVITALGATVTGVVTQVQKGTKLASEKLTSIDLSNLSSGSSDLFSKIKNIPEKLYRTVGIEFDKLGKLLTTSFQSFKEIPNRLRNFNLNKSVLSLGTNVAEALDTRYIKKRISEKSEVKSLSKQEQLVQLKRPDIDTQVRQKQLNKLLVTPNAPNELIRDLQDRLEKDKQTRQALIEKLTAEVAEEKNKKFASALRNIGSILDLKSPTLWFGVLTGAITGNYLALKPLLKGYRSLTNLFTTTPKNFFANLTSNAVGFGLKMRENIAHTRVFGVQLGALTTIVGTLGALGLGASLFGKQLYSAAINAGELRKQIAVIDRIRGTKASQEIEGIQKTALNLGVNQTQALSGFSNFASATRGGALEANASEYYQNFLKAAKQSGLGQQEQDLALQALTQTASKKRLYSEELRGQLSEHLPSAIPVASQALGYESTRDFLEEIQSKTGISDAVFIPSFTKALAVESSVQDTDNLVNANERLSASSQSLGIAIGANLEKSLTAIVNIANELIKSFTPIAKVITDAFIPITSGILINAFGNLFKTTGMLASVLGATFNTTADLFKVFTSNLDKIGTSLLGLARNLGVIALAAIAVQTSVETVEFAQGKLSALHDQTKALKQLNAELERKNNLESSVTRNDANNPDYTGSGEGISGLIVKGLNQTELDFINPFLGNSFDAFETIEGSGNVAEARKKMMATREELALAEDIATGVGDFNQNVLNSAGLIQNIKPKVERTNAIDLELSRLNTLRDKTPEKNVRAKLIKEKIEPLEQERAKLSEDIAASQQGITSLKALVEKSKAQFTENATKLGFGTSAPVKQSIASFDKTIDALDKISNKFLNQIGKLSDGTETLVKITAREKDQLEVFTRETTRQSSEKEAILQLQNPLGDSQLSLNSARLNFSKNQKVYQQSNASLQKTLSRVEDPQISEILKSKGLSINSSLTKIQSAKEKINRKEEEDALILLEEYVTQRENNSQNFSAYGSSLVALKEAEFRFSNSFVQKANNINQLRNELDRVATANNNINKRATANLNLTGRFKTVADQNNEVKDIEFRSQQESLSTAIAKDFLTTDKKAKQFLTNFGLSLTSPLEKVTQVLSDQPLDKEQKEIGAILQGYLTDTADLDNLLTQKATTLESISSSTYDYAKNLASILNGLEDGLIAATRSLQDAKLNASTKIRGLNQQINQKLNELQTVNLDISNIISKRELTGKSAISGLVNQAVDSLNNLEKSKLTQNTSLEQAQFDLDQRILDAQTELIQVQRELADAVRQAYLNQQQNAESIGLINSDGTRQTNRVLYDPVIDQTKALEALNLPNVKVIWNTPNTPIKTTTEVGNLPISSQLKASPNPLTLVRDTIQQGKDNLLQKEIASLNSTFTVGDKEIISAIERCFTTASKIGLETFKKEKTASSPFNTQSSLNTQENQGYGIIEFGDGTVRKISNGVSDRQSTVLPPSNSDLLEEGTGIIEFGDGTLVEIKNGTAKKVKNGSKQSKKYYLNNIDITQDKVSDKKEEVNQRIQQTVNTTKAKDILRGEDLLNITPQQSMEFIDTLLQQQLEVTKARFNVVVDSVKEQKEAALELFTTEKELAEARYKLDYESAINDSKQRQRSYSDEIRQSANTITQTNFDTLQLANNDPSQNRGINGIFLRRQLGAAQIDKEIADSQFKVDTRQLELDDSKSALSLLETRQRKEKGLIAEETQKEINLAKQQISNLEIILSGEEEQLSILKKQRYEREELLDRQAEIDSLNFSLNREKFTTDNSYAAEEYFATQEVTGNRFESDRLNAEIGLRKELLALKEREIQINNQALTEGFSESDRQLALSGSIELFESNLKRLTDSTNTYASIFKETLASPLTNFFQDLISGSKSLEETVLGLAQGIVSNLAQISAQLITNWLLTQALGGLFGLGGNSGIGNASFGGIGGLLGGIFYDGGTVGQSKALDLTSAYRTEKIMGGGEPTLAMLTKGEEVLSKRKGDAQLYRSLKQSGVWQQLKQNKTLNTPNASTSSSSPSGSTSSNVTIVNNSKYNITTPDSQSFSKSRNQLDSEANNRFRRTTRFS